MDEFKKKVSAYTKLTDYGSHSLGACPFCKTNDSFVLDQTTNSYFCLSCKAGGNAEEFQRNVSGKSVFEILKKRPLPSNDKELFQINRDAATFLHKKLMEKENDGLNYLRDRGLTDLMIKRFLLGYCDNDNSLYEFLHNKGYKDELLLNVGLFSRSNRNNRLYCKFFNRIMFPIFDEIGRVVGFGGRVLNDSKPKYLNSPESLIFNKSAILYGFNFAKNSKSDEFLLCEGQLDVISLHQAGFTNAIAPMGVALTETHIKMIKAYKPKVKLLQDTDESGMIAKRKAFAAFSAEHVPAMIVDLSPAKDPDEFIKAYGADTFAKRLDKAMLCIQHEVDFIMKNCNKNDFLEYKEALEKVSKLLL